MKTFKKFKTVIVVIFVCFIVYYIRNLYYSNSSLYFFYPDTYHYLNRAQELANHAPLVNPFRLPLYPLVLLNLSKLRGDFIVDSLNIYTINFRNLLRFQKDISLLGAFFFILLSGLIFGYGRKFLLVAIIYALNIRIFGWDKNILTECLTLAVMSIYVFSAIKFITSKNLLYLLVTVIISDILFLLRPVYLILTFALLPFIIYHLFKQNKLRLIIASFFIVASTALVPLYYSYQNYKLYSYTGISTVPVHNLLAKIWQYRLDLHNFTPADKYEKILYDCVKNHPITPLNDTTDCLFALNLEDNLYSINSAKIIGPFAKKIILKQPFTYIARSTMLFPHALITTASDMTWISTWANNNMVRLFWNYLLSVYNLLQITFLSFFILYPYSLYCFFKKPDQINTIVVILGIIVFYQLSFNTFFVQSEYIRLRAPIEPILLLYCFYYYLRIINAVFHFLKTRLSKEAKKLR
ncbi:hypothetical protein A2W14_00440 [Candidatus Gottesmanbacteria bacterium RBG_16_37_8]|uniref:Glycosyltransferase RgtA/B/C/D-like domain-containing protein n=1 Tax=Candidatus Gottesmanbacteria bacterium RBG_16_37_8 TaxID=1798371 RepID=A0A1F5YQM5_9BACT|nr:MAG: hypothetical protein A2W14_00440 [Candidatus Gottesmanbacteria bacterium RBG_16_37_8]